MASCRPPLPLDPLRLLSRRDLLKVGVLLGGGAAIASIAGCAPRRSAAAPSPNATGSVPAGSGLPASAAASPALSGPITMIAGGGDPLAEPALRGVFDAFADQHPGVAWDIRSLAGGGPEWDRLARALIASGEPVGLTMIDGRQLRPWARDGLVADRSADPRLADVLARVPAKFQIGGPGERATRAFPLAVTRGVHTTGLFYNRTLLDEAGVPVPRTIADLESLVTPLAKLGAAPLVHCSGDVFFNQILLTWILPMIPERVGTDPSGFADDTVRGLVRYDGPEWREAFGTIASLRATGVLLDGSGATDYLAMQRLFLAGKAAATFQGSWMLAAIQAGTPSRPFELHVAPPPLVDGASRARPILAWGGYALPATSGHSRDAVYAFLEYASRPEVDRAVTAASQRYSPIAASNDAITDPIAREFLPLFDDAISPLDWLWEPEVKDEIDRQVQALVTGDTDAAAAGRAVQAIADDLRATGRGYYQ
jgi:arabinogalactan oligomer/maltooligosaccharide transport system substrate-binding protein